MSPSGRASQVNNSWIISIALSIATTFFVTWATIKLFLYYVEDLLGLGLDAGVGAVFLTLFGSPIIFLFALAICRIIGKQPTALIGLLGSWSVALLLGLMAGILILLGLVFLASASWRASGGSFRLDLQIQKLIVFGFPTFSLGIYGIVLALMRRLFRRRVRQHSS